MLLRRLALGGHSREAAQQGDEEEEISRVRLCLTEVNLALFARPTSDS